MADDKYGTPGQRVLPAVIDERSRLEPDSAWALLPVDDADLSRGFEPVTYAVFANAINKLAWHIVGIWGRSTTCETVAYLGTPDIRYHILQMAASKVGYKALFSSQLNSAGVHAQLMERTACTKLLSAVGVHVDDVLLARPGMDNHTIPELDDLLTLTEHVPPAPPMPFTKTFEQAKRDPYLVLHTSGTTGDPKPVVFNHAGIAAWDAHQLLPDITIPDPDPNDPGRTRTVAHNLTNSKPGPGARFLAITSPFHALSAVLCMVGSILGGGVFVPGLRHGTIDASDVPALVRGARPTKALLTPWTMEDLARRADAPELLGRFESLVFGGAVLSPRASELWARHTHAQNSWGSTEILIPPMLTADGEDHSYNYFDMEHGGLEMRPVEEEDEQEQVRVRSEPGPAPATAGDEADNPKAHALEPQLYEVFVTLTPASAPYSVWHARENISLSDYPSPQTTPPPAYPVGDLFAPHPDPIKNAAGAWRYVGRKDDLIVFSTGVNWHPGATERSLTRHPAVRAAVVVGSARRQAVGVLEKEEGVDLEAFVRARSQSSKKKEEDVEKGEDGEEKGGGGESDFDALYATTITEANAQAPAHGHLAKTHILLVPAGAFARTPKGSVARGPTVRRHAGGIEEIYKRFGDVWQSGSAR